MVAPRGLPPLLVGMGSCPELPRASSVMSLGWTVPLKKAVVRIKAFSTKASWRLDGWETWASATRNCADSLSHCASSHQLWCVLSSRALPQRGRTKELKCSNVQNLITGRFVSPTLALSPWVSPQSIWEWLKALNLSPTDRPRHGCHIFLPSFMPSLHQIWSWRTLPTYPVTSVTVQCYIFDAESPALGTHEPYCHVISFYQRKSFYKSQAFARCSVLSNILFVDQREKESQKTYFHFLQKSLHAFDLSACANIFYLSSQCFSSFFTFLLSITP